jgi:YVTN family beta-propeller protein
MRTRSVTVALLLASTACAALRGAPQPLAPLGSAAEVHVFLQRLPREAERLSFAVEGVALLRPDGTELPLAVETRGVDGADPSQRHLAWARVPAGEYAGLAVRISSAAIGRGPDRSRLLTDPEPIREDLHLHLAPGRSAVVWLELGPSPVQADFSFAPRFTTLLASRTAPRAALYMTDETVASVSVADRAARAVTDVIPVPGRPRGIAVDALANRAFVALHLEDRLEVLDLAAGIPVAEIRLQPGDGPGDVGVAADGTIVVVNVRSRTVAFLDPGSLSELARVPVGDDPYSLLVDRQGRRAYVANRGSGTISVIDIGNRAVIGTIPTDPEPLRTALSFDGTLLYVVTRGSHYVASFAIPTLVPGARVFVGLGAVALKVDPRTGLIYLSRGGERRIAVLDPLSLQQVDAIEAPGAVSIMTIDDAENTLLALQPERRTVLVVDLTSRRVLAEIPAGASPYALAFFGERP